MSTVEDPLAIKFDGEEQSNKIRRTICETEPHSLRTYTPSQAVLSTSAGVFHWTPEGRRLYDYTSGVLVANLGHNPVQWMKRFTDYLGWTPAATDSKERFFKAVSMTAYNAITELEAHAAERLVRNITGCPGGNRMDTVIWAASGSEAVQKALWACMKFDKSRPGILATRNGFHGKKGLSGAVTGGEQDSERDARVKFITFPQDECSDLETPKKQFDPTFYRDELERICESAEHPIGCLITEPYLGGGGSYHPPHEYLQLLEAFCRERDILFILDEIQANFGRTGHMYAFESYGIEPDFVCLGKGLGNGVPVSAAVGRRDVCEKMGFGETSDTWSANPISSAAVLATLDEFESTNIIERTQHLCKVFTEGLLKLKDTGLISCVRGEGMVFGIEAAAVGSHSAAEVANAIIERCYRGDEHNDGIHLLGPLAGCVIRIAPPMCMTDDEANHSLSLLHHFVQQVANEI